MKTKKQNKIQKRSIELIEYEDNKWKILGAGWALDLKKGEVDEAITAWMTGKLKEECSIKLKTPRILKN